MAKRDDDSGLGILGAIVGIGLVGLLARGLGKEEREARAREEKRKNTPCKFNDGVSQAEFTEIVKMSGKRIKRLTSLISHGPIVYGMVESQSGLSEWSFEIDFNDYGHITGEYWITTDNDDSKIPERVADRIKKAILNPEMSGEDSFYDQNEYDEDSEDRFSEEYHGNANKNTSIHKILKKKSHVKRNLILILIMVLVMVSLVGWYEYKSLIPISYSEQSLVGLEYELVVKKLEDAGFSHVSTEEIDDLSENQTSEEYVVTDVKIGWVTSFSGVTKLPSNFPVTITYHTLEKIAVPMSSKEAKGSNYKEVQNAFKDAGFTNISTKVEYDIVTGWITDDGEVESIIIDENEKFDSGDKYKLNSEVVITYHTFRKNKPD